MCFLHQYFSFRHQNGCIHLAKLENLTSLNLSQNERITNRGAASLANLVNLRALNLSNTRVNSAALRFLGGLVKLQSLALYGCRGIDDSASISLLHSELPSLKCLRLNNKNDDDDDDSSDDDDVRMEDEYDDNSDDEEEEEENDDLLQEYQMDTGDNRQFSVAQIRQNWDNNEDDSSSSSGSSTNSDNDNSTRRENDIDDVDHHDHDQDMDVVMNEENEENHIDIVEDNDIIIDHQGDDTSTNNIESNYNSGADVGDIHDDDDDSQEFHRAEGYFSDEISATDGTSFH